MRWIAFGIALAFLAACEAEEAANGHEPETDSAPTEELAQEAEQDTQEVPGFRGNVADRFEAFTYVRSQDPITDEDESFVYTESVYQQSRSPSGLAWRCEGKDLRLVLAAGDFLTSGQPVDVQWRLDEEEPTERRPWTISTQGTGAFAPPADLVQLTEEAPNASRIRMRAYDYQGTPHDYEFRMEGLPDALAQLSCTDQHAREYLAQVEQGLLEEQRRRDSARAAAQRRREFLEAHPFAAHPEREVYMPTDESCWTTFMDTIGAEYFRSRREAEEAGYRPSQVCQ